MLKRFKEYHKFETTVEDLDLNLAVKLPTMPFAKYAWWCRGVTTGKVLVKVRPYWFGEGYVVKMKHVSTGFKITQYYGKELYV